MKHKILYTIIALFTALTAVNGATPSNDSQNGGRSRVIDVNTWKHYIAYADAQKVIPTGNDVFVLSSGKLYSFTITDGYPSYTEYSTISGLSDHNDIADIQYNSSLRKIIIAYDNANIDILSLKDRNVVNIPAIVNLNTINTKSLSTVLCHGKNAYINTRWGVVIVNMEKCEVIDTYRLDTDIATGEQLSACWIEDGYLYVTANKARPQWNNKTMARGLLTDNLLDKNKWTPVDDAALQTDITKKINDYQYYYVLHDAQSKKRVIEDKTHKCYWTVDDEGSLVKCNSEGEMEKFFNVDTQKEQAHTYKPYGPKSNDFWNIYWIYDRLYTVSGIMSRSYYRASNDIQILDSDGRWTFIDATMPTGTQKLANAIDISVDPTDTSHIAISAQSGLYEFRNRKFVKHWNSDNSPIKSLGDGTSKSYQMVLGSLYDNAGKLYVLNSYTSNGLLSLENGDTWKSHNHWAADERFISSPKLDSKGNVWFINEHWDNTAFYCYNPTTNTFRTFHADNNQDGKGLYSSTDQYLHSLNIDKDDNVWLCGTLGLAYLPVADQTMDTKTVRQHKINRNDNTGLADYLLSTVNASCIAFDDRNRKYVGTIDNGLYVISEDNNTELANYNTQNSNILSNEIYKIALDKQTGILYISTDKGLCSVQTDGWPMPTELNKDDIKVFPNPVSPDYTGPITIEGLPADSDIKIVTSSGAIVHRGRSTLSYYQWDGCDLGGDRCASGVYYILLATSNGEDGCVAKIAMIR